MTAIASLFVILTLSFLMTRLATMALVLTGVSGDLARLQAISAFTGVGFTTQESEHIVGHPARRRILILLMVVGNAGIITAVASLILSFSGVDAAREGATRFLWLAGGTAALTWLACTSWVEHHVDRFMRWALNHWTDLGVIDFSELLRLSGAYRIRKFSVKEHEWVAGKRLEELQLFEEGVTVLGIHRGDGEYVGVPRGETEVRVGDTLVLYGAHEDLAELQDRRQGAEGDSSHREGVRETEGKRRRQRESGGAEDDDS